MRALCEITFAQLEAPIPAAWRSWVLRGVADGVAEEARTRGFASLSFDKFAFV